MTIELKVPPVGESIQEVQIGKWLKQLGESLAEDQPVVELETDKASLEVPAPAAGVLAKMLKREGDTVSVGEVIGLIEQSANSTREPETSAPGVPDAAKKASKPEPEAAEPKPPPAKDHSAVPATPSARRALREHGLTADEVESTGDRLRREDVMRHVQHEPKPEPREPQPENAAASKSAADLGEEIRPMSLIRKRIAKRLVEAQHTAALLTTFNEIDMSAVIALRKEQGERFLAKYGIKLGFMSFFAKAVIDALRQFPELNAEIRDNHIVYRSHYHLGIAIGASKGLVVPVLRNAQWLSFAETEQAIADFAKRAEQNKLEPQELEGGTFTITNGGVYGSLLSTPIVNPPQSGVLGMHAIVERPIGLKGQIVLRPMMYVALTYDHRLVDGRQAVTFLKRIKDAIEDPARMLLEV